MERIDELKDAVAAGGGQVLVGFQFRFHPGLAKCAQLLGEGAIGRPLSVRAVYGEYLPDMHPWEDYRGSYSARHDLGGGAVLTLCHPLDYLRWLLGEVQDLWAFADRLNDFKMQVDDTAEVGLRFTSGALGSVNMNYNQRPRAQNLEIVGTTGTLRWDNDTGRLSVFEVSASSVSGAANGEWVTFPVPDGFDRNDMFLAEMEHFLAVVRGEAQPVCTLEDGVKALELALAIHESGRSRELIRI
jgi:predicted dehydrogenase